MPASSINEQPSRGRRGALLVGLGHRDSSVFSVRRFLAAFGEQRSTDPEALARCTAALAEAMPEDWRVYWAVRFGRPSIAQVVRQVVADGVDDLTVVSMHPQTSRATTAVIAKELYGALGGSTRLNATTRMSWHDDAGYVNAQARLIAEFASQRGLTPDDTYLVFLANQAWVSTRGTADSYFEQCERTARLVGERVGWPAERVAVRFGRSTALHEGVSSAVQVERRGESDHRTLICPLTVAADDIGIDTAAAAGVHVCPVLGTQDAFVSAMKHLVLRGPRPMAGGRGRMKPLLVPRAKGGDIDELSSLLMVGTSLPGRIRSRRGPYVAYSDPVQLRSVKKSRRDLRSFLDWTRAEKHVLEAFVWNTCQRVEFYGWLTQPDDLVEREYIVAQVCRELFGPGSTELKVNVLFGVDAWHHMTRTAAGLNSELPGDTDIVAQLETSYRVAERIDAAGLRARHLVDDAVQLAGRVRHETAWGRFGAGYCLAALSRVCDVGGTRLDEYRHVIVGGSATSRSILSTLSERFRVPQSMMTLVYRDHHGQMRLLRAALGHGRRLRVHSYADPEVLELIAQADFVYFGIDYPEPVLDPTMLAGLRDFIQRPLTVVDFNSFGSINDEDAPGGVTVWTAGDLDQAVAAYADSMCGDEQFAQAYAEADSWIENHMPVPAKPGRGPAPADNGPPVTRSRDAQRGASAER